MPATYTRLLVLILPPLLLFAGCKKKSKDDINSAASNFKVKRILINGDDKQEYLFQYDQNNVLSKITAAGVGDLPVTDKIESNYTFSASGNLLEITSILTTLDEGNTSIDIKYEYDANNRITVQHVSYDNEPLHISRRFFYPNGLQISVEYNNDEMYDSTVYYMNSVSNKADSSRRYQNGLPNLTTEAKFTYNAQGFIIKREYRQPSFSATWKTTEENQYDVSNPVTYPEELHYFIMGLEDIEDLLDPSSDLNNNIPVKTINYTDCSSVSYSLTDKNTFEKDEKGRLTKQLMQGEDIDYSSCSKTSESLEYVLFY